MSSWQHHQARAKSFYADENYSGALESYTEAHHLAQSHAPRKERSILLSNIVACRLHIGGSDNLAIALEEATECISLNEKWSKGHIRLASVYIAMGNRSNDACRALQTAIRLDPSNSNSRKMLMKELRRDHSSNHSSNRNHDTTNTNTGQSSSDERASSQPASASSRTTTNTQSERNDYESRPPETQSFFATNRTTSDHVREEEGVDDAGYRPINGQSWVQWMYEKFHQIQSWYEDSTETTKQVVKVVLILLLLYIAFGGRFGFENTYTSSSYRRGNYGENNAYDRFYSNSGRNNNSNSNSNSNRRRTYEQNDNDNVNNRYNSYTSDNDARYNSGSYEEQYSNSYRPNRNSHDHSNRRHNQYGMDYNTTAMLSVVVILVLKQLGVPIHHLAPAMGFGGMGMRRMGMGRGFGGFGRGRMGHVNVNGFRVPLPRHGMFGRRY